ncbi:MAG: alpha/beta hydrolase [Aestuariivirga sp.]
MTNYHTIERPAPAGAPLFFTFHGTGGDETQFFDLAQSLKPDAHVISLRGDVSEHGALRFFKRKAEGVYDMEDLALRTKALAEFVADHKSRSKAIRVIGLGYSNGANILASVIMANPQLFSDAILMHPLIPWKPIDFVGVPKTRVLITAGKRDPICPAPLTQNLAGFLRGQGSSVELVWHDGGHDLRQVEVDAAKRFLA